MYRSFMSDELVISSHAAKGGKARAESLSAKRRSEIAKKAAQTRWRNGHK